MADTVTEKLSDERLREIIENTAEALDFLKGWPQFNGVAEKLSMARELLSRRTAPAEPVAFIERAVLDQLAKHKDATGTVASGLLKRPFGDPVPLYAAPPASPAVSDEMVERFCTVFYGADWAATSEGPVKSINRDEARAALLAALGGHHD